MIIKSFNRDNIKQLVGCGAAPQDLLHGRNKVDLDRCTCKITQDIPNVPQKIISINKQIQTFEKIFANPIRGSYTLCISSYPTDLRAKQVAAFLMLRAMELHSMRKPGRSLPVWHRVFGGFGDTLRDKESLDKHLPTLLVISNILDDSSAYKMEKVRDLLEKYNSIPRIVVTSGADPCTFFVNRLHFPLNAALYLGPDNRIEED